MLKALDDPHYTTELGIFNLELNIEPSVFGQGCLRKMEEQLDYYVGQGARDRAQARRGHRPHGHPAHDPQVRPRPREHDAPAAVRRPQQGDDRPARRPVRIPHQGRGRPDRQARQRDARGVQHELPGPLSRSGPRSSRVSTTSRRRRARR
jgi:hypothetical protein